MGWLEPQEAMQMGLPPVSEGIMPLGPTEEITPEMEGSVFDAAMQLENTYVSWKTKWQDNPGSMTEQENAEQADGTFQWLNHVPEEYIGTKYESQYAKYGTSARHAQWVTDNIRRQEQNRQIISENPWSGIPLSMLAAATSPEVLPLYAVPGALLWKGSTTIGKMSLGSLMGAEAVIGGSVAGLSEYMLHQTQETRTKTESMYAIGGSIVFGGILVGLGYSAKASARILKELDDDMIRIDSNPLITSVGAAETRAILPDELRVKAESNVDAKIQRGEIPEAERSLAMERELKAMEDSLSQVKHPKLMRVMGFMHPSVRIATSNSAAARELGAKLVDDPLSRVRHEYGDSLGTAAEIEIGVVRAEVGYQVNRTLNDSYHAYKKAAKQSGEKVMKYDQFADEVGRAHVAGDVHANEFVQDAATKIRNNITKPIEKRLMEQGLVDKSYSGFDDLTPDMLEEFGMSPEELATYFRADGAPRAGLSKIMSKDIKEALAQEGFLASKAKLPKGDAGYFHRSWDGAKIQNNPNEFVDDIVVALREEAKDTLGRQEARLQTRIDSLTEQLADRKKPVEIADADRIPRPPAQRILAKREIEKIEKQYAKELKEVNQKLDYERTRSDIDNAELSRLVDEQARLKRQRIDELAVYRVPVAREIAELMDDLKKLKETNVGYIKNTMDRDLDRAANEVKNNIIGMKWTPGFRPKTFQAGPLKARTFHIATKKVDKWVNKNAETVWNDWVEAVTPQVVLRERFGSDDLADQLKQIETEYDGLIRGKTGKAAAKLEKEKARTMKDVSAMIESLHGRLGKPDDPNSIFNKAASVLRAWNYMTLLGQVTVSAIPDLGHIIMRHGLGRVTKNLAKVVTWQQGARLSMAKNRTWGAAADLVNNNRAMKLGMMDTDYRYQTRFDRFGNKAATTFTRATGMSHWNAGLKQFVGFIYSDDILAAAQKAAKGTLNAGDMKRFARGGLSKSDLAEIATEFKAQKISMQDGVRIPDPNNWQNKALGERFKSSVAKEVDTTIVTPGMGDLPLVSRGEIGRLVLQFKSFAMSANSKMVLATIDDFNARKMIGIMTLAFFGGVSQITRDAVKGKEVDYTSEQGRKQLLKNAIDRSGMLSIWGDVNGIAQKATLGKVDMFKLLGLGGEPLDRYASRNVLGAMLGPSAGRVSDITQLTAAISSGEIRESDARAIRRAIAFNNIFYLHRAFNKMEEAIGGRTYGPFGEEE